MSLALGDQLHYANINSKKHRLLAITSISILSILKLHLLHAS